MAPFRTFARFMMVMATMTERTLNLVVPLAHKATAMRLTLSTIQDYRSSVAETKATGIGVLFVSGDKPQCSSNVAFLSSGVPLNGRPDGRSLRARLRLPGTPTPVSAAHPIGVVWAVHKLNRSKPTMNTAQSATKRRTAAPLPFYSYNADKKPLFTINENVPFEDVLDHAGCFISSLVECSLSAAEKCDVPEAWAAYYMAQIASALIESMTITLIQESK